jgi:hypothetical protein
MIQQMKKSITQVSVHLHHTTAISRAVLLGAPFLPTTSLLIGNFLRIILEPSFYKLSARVTKLPPHVR